jgi:hypothetical protein
MKKPAEIAAIVLAICATFFVVNFLHFQWFRVSVILYACIIDIVIASIVVLAPYARFRWRRSGLTQSEVTLAAMVGALCALVYSVMGPTVIDRSLSIYIVEKLESRGGHIAHDAFKELIQREFMDEYRVADVRLTEQLTSGTAKLEDGCIVLTPRGVALAKFTHWYRATLLPKHRMLLGAETDQLTHPLRDSRAIVTTTCRKN